MITFSNGLSFIRAPLALLFLQGNPHLRFLAVFLAMVTDSVDGYFARRYKSVSRFGAILDPAMDKLFVYSALTAYCLEGKIALWACIAMISRDFSVCLFTLFIFLTGGKKSLFLRSLRWGKVTTALQFVILMCLTYNIYISWPFYAGFIALGCLALCELFNGPRSAPIKE